MRRNRDGTTVRVTPKPVASLPDEDETARPRIDSTSRTVIGGSFGIRFAPTTQAVWSGTLPAMTSVPYPARGLPIPRPERSDAALDAIASGSPRPVDA
jgi:hypothetical protein